MTREVSRQGGDVFMSGPMINSSFGNGNVIMGNQVNWYSETDSASLDDLRELIALLQAEVEAAGGGEPTDGRVQYELQTIEEALKENEPDGEVIRSRWKQVLKLLGPLQDMASVAQITASILALFGGS